jgi:hypothetical protein
MMARASTAQASTGAVPALRKRPPCRDFGGDARSAELIASMEAHQRAISTHHGALLQDIAEFDRHASWRGDGALNMAAWLANHLRISAATARAYVVAAENLDGLPRLADALSEGSLTLDVLTPLAAVAKPADDAKLAEAAVDWTVRQARELAQAARQATDAQAADQYAGRYLRFNDDQCTIWARLPKDKYAQVKSTLSARARRMDQARRKARASAGIEYEPFDRLQADALVEVCTERGRRGGGGEGDSGGGGGGGGAFGGASLGAPATVVVHIDAGLLADCDGHRPDGDQGGGSAAIEGLGPISREVARRLCCDAKINVSLDAADGTCLDQQPLRRNPSTAQRIEIRRRDSGCRFPGCGFTTYTDVHHMRLFTRGGTTTLDNLITLCTSHHHAVHELGWSMTGDANRKVTFTRPHGHSSISSPSPVWKPVIPLRR